MCKNFSKGHKQNQEVPFNNSYQTEGKLGRRAARDLPHTLSGIYVIEFPAVDCNYRWYNASVSSACLCPEITCASVLKKHSTMTYRCFSHILFWCLHCHYFNPLTEWMCKTIGIMPYVTVRVTWWQTRRNK